jgi:hypothetical protein
MKDRKRFVYSSEILKRHRVPMDDNKELKRVIEKEIRFDDLPIDEETEFRKGFYFADQATLVGSHDGQELLCEVLENEPCLQKKCPMFLPRDAKTPMENRYGQPLCGEFRIVFERTIKS